MQLTLPVTENGAMEKFPDLTLQVKSFDVVFYIWSFVCRADPKLSPF